MPGFITRVQLIAQIQTALSSGNVIIASPAGYGKSTLLRQIAAQRINSHYLPLTVADSDISALRARLHPHLEAGETLLLDDIHHLAGWMEAATLLSAEIRA